MTEPISPNEIVPHISEDTIRKINEKISKEWDGEGSRISLKKEEIRPEDWERINNIFPIYSEWIISKVSYDWVSSSEVIFLVFRPRPVEKPARKKWWQRIFNK